MSPALDAARRGLEAGSFLDTGSWSNGVAALLLGTMAVSTKPW